MKDSTKYWESTCEVISEETRDILNEYLLTIKLENKSEATILKYKNYLERFLQDCAIPIDQLTSDDILTWFKEYSQDKKTKTIDLVHSILSSFFRFCLVEEYMGTVVMKKRWKPKITDSLPKYLNEHELARLKRVMETLSKRDRAIILFLLTTGCRNCEIINLSIQDVDLYKRTAIVRGKGNKIRYVNISEECAIVLKDYLRTRFGEPIEPLFLNNKGQRLGEKGIYCIVRKLEKRAGFVQKLHSHVLRQTLATYILANGTHLHFINDKLGPLELNETRNYIKIPTVEIISAYQNIMGEEK